MAVLEPQWLAEVGSVFFSVKNSDRLVLERKKRRNLREKTNNCGRSKLKQTELTRRRRGKRAAKQKGGASMPGTKASRRPKSFR